MIINFISLAISLIATISIIFYLKSMKRKNDILFKEFIAIFTCISVHILGMLLQVICNSTPIPDVYFEYIAYIGAFFTPVCFLFLALSFYDKKIKIRNKLWLLIVPIISLLMLWTNDLHGLFYQHYSTDINNTIYGGYFYIYSIFSYLMLFLSIIILIKASIRNSGFFSKQTGLIVLGSSVPIVVNVLGTLKIIPMNTYITPVTFVITSICFAYAIIKYKALNITPIAFRTVIDTMSDAFIVISDDGTYVDSNVTFKKMFSNVIIANENSNLFDIIKNNELLDLDHLKSNIMRTRNQGDIVSEEYHMKKEGFDKYFEVDIHPIKATPKATEYVGTLLLFKDITQHKKDIQAIEEKQDIIVKQGQLASIGELAGGVAHDINTPIAAIKTGIVMLNSMTSERTDNEKEILQRMDNCATKIINIVNSMRNQIRNLGGDTIVKFKISEVVKDIKIITYHEVAKNKSEVDVEIRDDLEIKGDPTKLGQVLTNLVVNAVQAYGETGGKVKITIETAPENMAMIKVADFAGGLDDKIAPYVFKNILTTKGTSGTGLGLYLVYSVIVGVFNGNIKYDTEKGKGTTFYITIPRS